MGLEDIASQIIDDLNFNERVRLANLPPSELEIVEILLNHYIIQKLREINLSHTDEYASGEVHEAMKVVKKVWESLRDTHKLRVVK